MDIATFYATKSTQNNKKTKNNHSELNSEKIRELSFYLKKAYYNINIILNYIAQKNCIDIDINYDLKTPNTNRKLTNHTILNSLNYKNPQLADKIWKDLQKYFLCCESFTFYAPILYQNLKGKTLENKIKYYKSQSTNKHSDKDKTSPYYYEVKTGVILKPRPSNEQGIYMYIGNLISYIDLLEKLNEFYNTNTIEASSNLWQYYTGNTDTPLYPKNLEELFRIGIHKTMKQYATKLPTNSFKYLIQEIPENYQHYFFEKDNLNTNAIVFICNLFLEKQDAQELISKYLGIENYNAKLKEKPHRIDNTLSITQYKRREQNNKLNNTIRRQQATIYTYSIHHAVLPKKNQYSEINLTFDKLPNALSNKIITEISKCPKILFNSLNKEDKEKLAYNTSIDTTKLTLENKSYWIRKNDKFTYLALQYLEESKLFPNMNFKIQLGKLTLEHKIEDYQHQWQKEINVFGKLKTFHSKKQAYKTKSSKDINDIKAIEQYDYFAPHYNTHNQTISFTFEQKSEHIPSKIESLDENGNYFSRIENTNTPNHIYVWSKNDLASLIFWGIEQKKQGKSPIDIENQLKTLLNNWQENYKQFIEDISKSEFTSDNYNDLKKQLEEKYLLKSYWIPKSIKKFLSQKEISNQDFRTWVIQKLEQEIENVNELLLKFRNNRIKPQHKTLIESLLNDMISNTMSVSKLKKQIHKKNYIELFQHLIEFDKNKEKHKELLHDKLLGNRDLETQHPFLNFIQTKEYSHIYHLYDSYFRKKKRYLSELIQHTQTGKEHPIYLVTPEKILEGKYPFLKKSYLKKFKNTDDLNTDKYLKKNTHFVPKGFLNEIIDKALGFKNPKNDKLHNFTYTILQYQQEDFQYFYSLNRNVQIGKNPHKSRKIGKPTPEDLGIRFKKFNNNPLNIPIEKQNWNLKITQPEKQIRQYKIQDVILLEILKDLNKTTKQEALDPDIKLQKLAYNNSDNNKSILNNKQEYIINTENIDIKIETTALNLQKYTNYLNQPTVRQFVKTISDIGINKIHINSIQKELRYYDKSKRNLYHKILNNINATEKIPIKIINSLRRVTYTNSFFSTEDIKLLEVKLKKAVRLIVLLFLVLIFILCLLKMN